VEEFGDGPATGYVWAGDCNGGYPSFPNPTYVDAFTYGRDDARTTLDFEPMPTVVSLITDRVRRNGSRTLSCELSDRDGHRLAGERLLLTMQPWPGHTEPEPEQAGYAVTGASGGASFRVRQGVPNRYRCEFPGSTYGRSLSSWTSRIRPVLTAHVARRGSTAVVRGALTPAARGTDVLLRLRHAGHTRTVVGELRAGGRYAVRASLPPGRSRVRVSVAAGPGTTAATTRTFVVRRP
jgi:hypothetical protein